MSPRRLAPALLGVVLTGFAIFEVVKHRTGLVQLIGFAVLPDLPLLAGPGSPPAKGRLRPGPCLSTTWSIRAGFRSGCLS